MSLARTSKKTAKKAPARKASPRFPVKWPVPGTRAFQHLPAEERAWVLKVDGWYLKSRTLGAPSCMLREESFAQIRQNPAEHLPFLVKYWRVCPSIFSFALRTITNYSPNQPTVAATHRAWVSWLKTHQLPLAHAAE